MAKKKFYAVKKGNTVGIFESWEECQNAVVGVSGAEYKGFETKKDAEAYLNSKNVHNDNNDELSIDDHSFIYNECGAIAYVDGSYNQKINRYSFGCVILCCEGIYKDNGYGDEPEALLLRNVAGEIQGTIFATTWAKKNGYDKLLIRYDYEGIEKWITTEWKTGNKITKMYVDKMKSLACDIDLKFEKIKAHSGDPYNEQADYLAKKGLTSNNKKPNVRNGAFWFSVDSITYDDITTIIELIKEDESLNININESPISGGKRIFLVSGKEKVTLSIYNSCNALIQGKPLTLFSTIISYICELVDINVADLYNEAFSLNFSGNHTEEQYKSFLPNSYSEFSSKMKRVLLQAICNLNLFDVKYDASFLVQPAFRVLEAHLKKLVIDYGIVDSYNTLKNTGFDMFVKSDGFHYVLKQDRKGITNTAVASYIGDAYTYFNMHRHTSMHWDDPTAPLDTTRTLDTNTAHEQIKKVFEILDKYYTIK